MEIVKATLEGFAHRYAALGIRLGETEARALVIAVVRQENPGRMPTEQELDELSRSLVRRIDDLARQRL
jgi:hypothetical protein